MDVCCDLEVDVNGEGTFLMNKNVLSSYCGKFSKLFGKPASKKTTLKVIFQDFPGGTKGFELIAKFCYNHGVIELTPSDIPLLYSASRFMEMDRAVSGRDNLVEQIHKSLNEISCCYTWSDLLIALKQTQDLPYAPELVQRLLACMVGKIIQINADPSPCTSSCSPESCWFRNSCDSRSTDSFRASCCSRATWWFEDLSRLNIDSIEIAVKCMLSRKYDHSMVGKFLIYYQKMKSVYVTTPDEKCWIMEMVIATLCYLHHGSVSCKSLFMLLRAASSLNIRKEMRTLLEGLVGLRLDEATLDNLLMPAINGARSMYDVNLVLRLVRIFRSSGGYDHRMKKVADLLDLFLAEVAPDPYLKPAKVVALAMALPDSARDSYDEMYHAIDMYLQVHSELSEEERLNVCCVVNYEKLSPESCLHLTQNKKFTSRSAVQALVYQQQSKLRDLLQQEPPYTPKTCNESVAAAPSRNYYSNVKSSKGEEEEDIGGDAKKVVLYAGQMDVETENEKLRAQLKGMEWRVMELEKFCKKMQNQMAKMVKSSRSDSKARPRSIPKMCS